MNNKLFSRISFATLATFLVLGAFFIGVNKVQAVSIPGDVVINEIFTNPTVPTDPEWYELLNTTSSDISLTGWSLVRSVPGDTITLSGTLPARGILVFTAATGTSANNAGDVLVLNEGATPIHSVSYGDQPTPIAPNHVAAPGTDQSAIFNTGTWTVTATPSKGWFNNATDFTCPSGVLTDPSGGTLPPTLTSIATCLAASPTFVTTNMGSQANPSAASALYFEKSISATPVGRITFAGPLNLTDQNTVTFLQSVGTKMEALKPSGEVRVGLDTTTTSAFSGIAGTVKMYGVTSATRPNLIVRNNAGTIITSGGDFPTITPGTFDAGADTYEFATSHFTSFETTTTVTNEAQLLAALAGADTTITLGSNITLTAPLSISRTVVIDGSASEFTLSGSPITISSGAVTLQNMVLTGTENLQTGDGNYGIMVQGGSLTADNITMTVATNNSDNNVGFNVASGASLDLKNSTITVSDTGGNQQQYAVYAQSGAVSVTLNTNTFSFNAGNVSGAYSYLIGMQGALVSNYPTVTLTGTNTQNAYTKLLLVGADTLANKKVYAVAGNKVAVGERLGVIGDSSDGFYARTSTGWSVPVVDEAGLRTALDGSDTIITLRKSITLAAPLSISRTVVIDGSASEFTLSGSPITISSGAVTLQNMVLTGTENLQTGDGNYGIMVQGGSLTADNISMTVVTSPGTDNDGFNVASGASLDLKNSTITLTGAADNQHGIYAQSGAVAITLANNTFTFPTRVSSPYSYLISMQGALVSNYPTVTLTGTNTQNAYIKLLLVGADTFVNKKAYAVAGNKVVIGERLGIMGTNQGIYVRPTTGWVILESTQVELPAGGTTTVDSSTPIIVITNPSLAATITVPSTVTNASVDIGNLLSVPSGGNVTATLPATTINVTTSLSTTPVAVTIPVGTVVTAVSSWDGTINVPTIKENSTVTATADSGKTATVNSVIEVGFDDVKLTFDKAVRILIPGQAGKDVGYSRSGVFTIIASTCSADTQSAGNALADEGDCKINASNGLDLVIWTKHFTKFATYTQTTNTVSSSGGGGMMPIKKVALALSDADIIKGCSGGNAFNTSTGKPCTNITGVTAKRMYALGKVTLKNGSKGEAVKELQRFLNDKLSLGLVIDGKLGPKTIAVIKTWQKANGLVADGLIGPKTKALINQ